jgi:hypothetical protein
MPAAPPPGGSEQDDLDKTHPKNTDEENSIFRSAALRGFQIGGDKRCGRCGQCASGSGNWSDHDADQGEAAATECGGVA